jgi:hypothetical protein
MMELANKLLEVGEKLQEMIYDLYERAGCPYGGTESGMMEWLRERRKKANLEYEEQYKKEVQQMIQDITNRNL